MQDNVERDELDPADDARRRCKKNSPVLSCIGKRTKQGCDCGSEVGTVHSGQGPVTLGESKKSGKRESCEKDFVSRRYREYVLPCNDRG